MRQKHSQASFIIHNTTTKAWLGKIYVHQQWSGLQQHSKHLAWTSPSSVLGLVACHRGERSRLHAVCTRSFDSTSRKLGVLQTCRLVFKRDDASEKPHTLMNILRLWFACDLLVSDDRGADFADSAAGDCHQCRWYSSAQPKRRLASHQRPAHVHAHDLHSENVACEEHLIEELWAKLSQSVTRKNSWGLIFGAIAQFGGGSLFFYWFCSMLPICAMAILPWHQNTSRELFPAGLRKARILIAPIHFSRINCVMFSEWRVFVRADLRSAPTPSPLPKSMSWMLGYGRF